MVLGLPDVAFAAAPEPAEKKAPSKSSEQLRDYKEQEKSNPFFIRGDRAYKQGNFEQARLEYEQAVEAEPKNVLALLKLANANLNLNRAPEVERHLRRAEELEPDNPSIIDTRFVLYANQGRADEAIKLLITAIDQFPDYPSYPRNYAVLMADLGRGRESLDYLDKAIAKSPENGSLRLGRCMARVLAKEVEGAQQDLDAAARLDADSEQLLELQTKIYSERHEPARALEAAEEWIRATPADANAYTFKAQSLLRLGRLKEAHDLLTQLLTASPDLTDALKIRAEVNYLLGDEASAQRDLNALTSRVPSVQTYLLTFHTALTSGDFDTAQAAINQVLLLDPDNAEYMTLRARLYNQQENHQRSFQEVSRALEIDDKLVDAYSLRGFLYGISGEMELSSKDFEKALELDPNNKTTYLYMGQLYLLYGRPNEALAAAQKAQQLSNYDFVVSKLLIEALNRRGENDETLAECAKVIEHDPRMALPHLYRADVLRRQKKYREAFASYSKAIALDPDYYDAYMDHGSLCVNARRYQDAIKDYTEAIRIRPDYYYPHYRRGQVYSKINKFEQAIPDLQKALSLNPNSKFATHSLGYTLFRLGRYNEAIKPLEDSIELGNDDRFCYYYLGESIRRTGRLEEALDFYLRFENEFPKSTLPHTGRGKTLRDLGRYTEAITEFDQSIKFDKKDWNAYRERGIAYLQLEQPTWAIDDLSMTIKIDPKDTRGLYYRGDAYFLMGINADPNVDPNDPFAQSPSQYFQMAKDDYESVLKIIPNHSVASRKLAWFLATCPDANFRDGKRAEELANIAIKSTKGFSGSYDALAAAKAEQGDFVAAVQTLEDALHRASRATENETRMREYTERRQIYEEGQPFRTTKETGLSEVQF